MIKSLSTPPLEYDPDTDTYGRDGKPWLCGEYARKFYYAYFIPLTGRLTLAAFTNGSQLPRGTGHWTQTSDKLWFMVDHIKKDKRGFHPPLMEFIENLYGADKFLTDGLLTVESNFNECAPDPQCDPEPHRSNIGCDYAPEGTIDFSATTTIETDQRPAASTDQPALAEVADKYPGLTLGEKAPSRWPRWLRVIPTTALWLEERFSCRSKATWKEFTTRAAGPTRSARIRAAIIEILAHPRSIKAIHLHLEARSLKLSRNKLESLLQEMIREDTLYEKGYDMRRHD